MVEHLLGRSGFHREVGQNKTDAGMAFPKDAAKLACISFGTVPGVVYERHSLET
jgi:hypothetical protein